MTRRKDKELQEELRAHLEMAARDRIERGEDPADAIAAARREFGNIAQVQEVTRDMWGWRWLERLAQDLRYALRLLWRSPAASVVAVLSLVLGIGATTAIFQVINAVRLRSLPVDRPSELVEIAPVSMDGARGNFASWHEAVSNPVWEQIRDHQEAFAGTLAFGGSTFNLASGGEARPARGLLVSGSFFDVLGIQPARGRLLVRDDDRRGCALRAVISHGFWQRELAGDAAVVGRTLNLDAHPVEIVGVTPPSFFGLEVGRSFDVAVPICADPSITGRQGRLDSGTDWWLVVMGRLKPGTTIEQATAHLGSLSAGIFKATLAPNYPQVSVPNYLAMKLHAVPAGTGISFLRETYTSPLWLLLALAALVLVIACANLANLLLARASARARNRDPSWPRRVAPSTRPAVADRKPDALRVRCRLRVPVRTSLQRRAGDVRRRR
jgi:putative ABC transport system permease protein